ncbi:MAG TPA: STAS domain-containing protein [Acidimicrobiales bacterium]|jgi:anti-sigma B factor antagonist|nr:STAS domain-containing protein [Acidimicrobiales bacterium]
MNRKFSARVVASDPVSIVVGGDVDVESEERLVATTHAAVQSLDQPGARAAGLVMDLSAVTFMDSSGLRGILRSQEVAEVKGVRLRLRPPPGQVARLFATAGIADRFEYLNDVVSRVP